ncbi:MAG: helix-turn-helix transcriptional regulator [Oscillospiraceae bacterium]
MKYPNIEAERARLGLSYEQLAVQLCVSRKTLYNWIARGAIPQAKLIEMARLFECSVDYLLNHRAPKQSCVKQRQP